MNSWKRFSSPVTAMRCRIELGDLRVAALASSLVEARGQFAGLCDPLLGCERCRDQRPAHVAERLQQAPAGQHVVADQDDAAGREQGAALAQDRLADEFRNPAVYAVGDDVVERAFAVVEIGHALAADLDVAERQAGDLRLGIGHLPCPQIDAEKPRLGEMERHRDDVLAAGAANLEHARRLYRRGRHAEQAGDRADTRRMGPGERLGDIGQFVIARRDLCECAGSIVHACHAELSLDAPRLTARRPAVHSGRTPRIATGGQHGYPQ